MSISIQLLGNFFSGKIDVGSNGIQCIHTYIYPYIHIHISINQKHFVRWMWLNTQSTSMSATKMLRCALSEKNFTLWFCLRWSCWKNICSTESLGVYIYEHCTKILLQGQIENKIRHESRTSLVQRSVFSNFEICSMERRDIATLATLNSDITPRPIVVGGLRGRVSAIVAASLCWRNICSPVV